MAAIRAALDEGGGRGAATINRQSAKNLLLRQGRRWASKAPEAVPEALRSKRRIRAVDLDVAAFGVRASLSRGPEGRRRGEGLAPQALSRIGGQSRATPTT